MVGLNFTRTEDSREQDSREQDSREIEYTYEEINALDIPSAVIERYKREGFALRWLRVALKGVDDYMNIGKKQQDGGWEFVDPNEVPELMSTSFVREGGRFEGTVSRGDLALAKAPKGKQDARKEYYRNKTRALMEAVNSQLESASDSKMPISNNSRSTVTRGRTPSFADD